MSNLIANGRGINGDRYRWVILTGGFIILVVTIGSFYSFGVFLSALLNEFGWSRASISGAFSLATICMGSMAIPVGWLTDRFGPRPVTLVSGIILGTGYILVSLVTQPWHLIIIYGFIIGSAMGAPYVVQATTISRWFVTRRGLALGVVGAGIGLGTVLMPPVAAYLMESLDWRNGFITFGVCILMITVLGSLLLRRASDNNDSGSSGLSAPVLPDEHKAILRFPQFWLINLIFLLAGSCIFMAIVHLAPHAVTLGVDDSTAATVMSMVGGVIVVSRFSMGYVTDHRGSRFVLILGLLAMALAYLILLKVNGVIGMYWVAVIYGFAYGACLISQPTIVAEYFGMSSYGWVFGATEFCVLAGGALGPLLAGYIFDISGQYYEAFIIAAVLAIIALLLTIVLRRPGYRHVGNDIIGRIG